MLTTKTSEPIKNLLRAEGYHPRQEKIVVTFLFCCLILGQISMNYDSGAIPSVLDKIESEFGVTETMKGVLGALHYLGLVVASPIVASLLHKLSAKKVLLISIFFVILSVTLLALSYHESLLFTSRFLLGFTQAPFCIYLPIWIDEFAPESNLTMWMGLTQGGTILGITLGYLVTGYVRPWQYSMIAQVAFLLIVWIVLFFTPPIFIDLNYPIAENETSPTRIDYEASKRNRELSRAISINADPEVPDMQNGEDESTESPYHPVSKQPECRISFTSGTPKISSDSGQRIEGSLHSKRSQPNSGSSPSFFLPASTHFPSTRRIQKKPPIMALSAAGAVIETLTIDEVDNSVKLKRDDSKFQLSRHISLETPPQSNGMWSHLVTLFKCKIYVWTVFTLCALLYVVTGIQYWSTWYFITAKNVDGGYVRVLFSATAATAPTLGVFAGALIVDKLGGYKSAKGTFRALWFCLLSGCLATCAGVIASFLDAFSAIISMMWFLLFFGGAILPAATGIMIAAVPPSSRPFASSFSMFAYNTFGFALGTFLPGPFMSAFGPQVGMKLIFFWSFFGVFGMSMAILAAWRHRPNHPAFSAQELGTLYAENSQ